MPAQAATIEDPTVHTVLVSRLLKYVEPFGDMGLSTRDLLLRVLDATPQKRYVSDYTDERDPTYDIPRIRYFYDLFCAGASVDPLEVDENEGWGPALHDGYHRLCAAVLAKVETVNISYGGRIDYLHFLEGKRRTKPRP